MLVHQGASSSFASSTRVMHGWDVDSQSQNLNLSLLILTFQKFNEIIDSSRAEADLAEANITEVERLISSANNKSDEAAANLGDAQELAEEAASTAEGARDIANQTQQVRSGLSVH